MKKTLLTLSIICMVLMLDAQNFSIKAKSGDVELDASLDDINIKAKADIKLFKKDLSVEFNIGEDKIDNMLAIQMSPADIYMTAQVANLVKKDPEVVQDAYVKNKEKGWGQIAKEMGIKPGSAEFHALKGKAKGKKDKGGEGNGKGNGNGKGHGKGHGKK